MMHDIRNTQNLKRMIYDRVGNEYELISEFEKSTKKVTMKHLKCNHYYQVLPDNFLYGSRCPYCNGTKKKTQKEFIEEVYEKYGEDYKVLGTYKNSYTRILVRHNKCEHTFEVLPSTLLHSAICPYCNEISKGEELVENYLKANAIPRIRQYRGLNIKDKKLLSYDFYLPYTGTGYLIEYQGKQHYEAINFFGGQSTFKRQQYHDYLKRVSLTYTGIELIEIPYTIDTQEKINKYLDAYILHIHY